MQLTDGKSLDDYGKSLDLIEVQIDMYGGAQLAPRYRPVPLPLPSPVVKRELRYYRPESPPMPAPAKTREPEQHPAFDLGQEFRMYATCLVIAAVFLVSLHIVLAAFDPEPRLFVRLVAAEGLGEPREQSPLFKLAVDVDRIPDRVLFRLDPVVHVGGGDQMLRVSYRGVALALGVVPRFTISRLLLGRRAAGVVTVMAAADGLVLREDMRELIRAERQALGRVEFEADGDIPGLAGHLHCKFYLADGDQPVEGLPPCLVQKKIN